jgi:cytochrome c-type biogenesis protein CcmH/NrfG
MQNDIEQSLAKARELAEAGNNEQARMVLQEILTGESNNITALLMLGGSYFYDKMYAEAQIVYERLVQLEPGSGMMSIALFNSLWKQGKHEEAAGEIYRFIQIADKETEREALVQYAAISKAIAEGEYEVEE